MDRGIWGRYLGKRLDGTSNGRWRAESGSTGQRREELKRAEVRDGCRNLEKVTGRGGKGRV